MKPSACPAASRRDAIGDAGDQEARPGYESGRDAGGVEGLFHRRHRGLEPLEPAVPGVRDDPPQRSLRDAAAQHDLQAAATHLVQGRELAGHCGRVPQPGVEHERAQADVTGGPGRSSQGHQRREAAGKIGDRHRVESGLLGPHRRLDQGIDARKGRSGKSRNGTQAADWTSPPPLQDGTGRLWALAMAPDELI